MAWACVYACSACVLVYVCVWKGMRDHAIMWLVSVYGGGGGGATVTCNLLPSAIFFSCKNTVIDRREYNFFYENTYFLLLL